MASPEKTLTRFAEHISAVSAVDRDIVPLREVAPWLDALVASEVHADTSARGRS
jgi:hypothetical protein